MNTILLHNQSLADLSYLVRPPRIYVNGVRMRELELLEWNVDSKNDWGSLRLRAVGASKLLTKTMLPEIGDKVEVLQPDKGGVSFCGYVVRHELVAQTGSDRVAVIENELAVGLSQNVTGRYLEQDGIVYVDDPLRFNVGSGDTPGSITYEINSRQCRVFSSGAGGELWTIGDAIAYVLAVHLPAEFSSTSYDELMALAGDLHLSAYDGSKLSAKEILMDLASLGGLSLRLSRDGRGLVIYDSSSKRRRAKIKLQPPGENLDPAKSNIFGGEISLSARPARRPVRMLGDYKRYESTFVLCPGWEESLNTRQWQDFIPELSSDWQSNRFVYRRWTLNETGENSDYDEFDFSALNSNDFISSRPRKFLPCLSKNQGLSNGVIIEYRLSSSDDWQLYDGAVWLSDNDCSMVFTDGNLRPEYFAAAYDGTLEVRVTASVEADKRLMVELPGDPLARWDIHDYSGSAAIWLLHPGSKFYDGDGVSSEVVKDDTNRLTTIGQKYSIASSSATNADIILPWIDMSYHVGDEVDEIQGAEIELVSHQLGTACIKSLKHEFKMYKTHLTIEG